MPELKRLIESLNLSETVQFDNQMYPVQKLPHILAGTNLGLVPLEISSITDYILPLKLLEYLAMGIPSITVRNKAISHYFGEEDFPFYDPQSTRSLTAILDRLVANPDLVRQFQERAMVLREHFLWSREREKYLALLWQLAAPAVGPARMDGDAIGNEIGSRSARQDSNQQAR